MILFSFYIYQNGHLSFQSDCVSSFTNIIQFFQIKFNNQFNSLNRVECVEWGRVVHIRVQNENDSRFDRLLFQANRARPQNNYNCQQKQNENENGANNQLRSFCVLNALRRGQVIILTGLEYLGHVLTTLNRGDRQNVRVWK
ncbi:Hypothetical_protein [Hexamita inflata]|uniref:Hypothetical_protein n=1 Tax=Hexamita inflata TaxID=28002 RepID=A0ABP1GX77_9EUKA